MLKWQAAASVPLPYGTAPSSPTQPQIWLFPDHLVSLYDPAVRNVMPCMTLNAARFDEASGSLVEKPVGYYGWGTIIGFRVKRVPAIAASPTSADTYELVGANDQDIILMERLLSQQGEGEGTIQSLYLGYDPNPTGNAARGVQTGTAVTTGIAQVNGSTVTNPPALSQATTAATEDDNGLGLLNSPLEFVRLLWEASITRSGGFYLYYYDSTSAAGLPDRIFDDHDHTFLSLIIVYAKPEQTVAENRLSNYMNCALIGEYVDASKSHVQAGACPVQITLPSAGNAEVDVPNMTLTDLATAYFADLGDMARSNAELTLASTVSITVKGGVYQVSPLAKDTIDLAWLNSHFQVDEAATQAANPGIKDWDDLPAYTAVRLPSTTFKVSASPGGMATLGDMCRLLGGERQRLGR